MASYWHGGGYGDIVYSIPAYRAGGFDEYVLTPFLHLNQSFFDGSVIVPLLERAGIRCRVFAKPGLHVAGRDWVNGDRFRERFGWAVSRRNGERINIALRHFLGVGLGSDFSVLPWLNVRPRGVADVVFIRSPRYRPARPQVDWGTLAKLFAGRAVFLGFAAEHFAFCQEFGVHVPHLRPADFLEAGEIMAGSRLVVTNQTGLGAVAAGLGVSRLLEVCERVSDCRFYWANEFVSSREWAIKVGGSFCRPGDEGLLQKLALGLDEGGLALGVPGEEVLQARRDESVCNFGVARQVGGIAV